MDNSMTLLRISLLDIPTGMPLGFIYEALHKLRDSLCVFFHCPARGG